MKSGSEDVFARYEDGFSDLNVGRASGHEKPHKPVMLLAVLDLFENGRISGNRIAFEPEILERFKAYFDVVKADCDALTPLLPFFHLRGDRFWHHQPRPGQEAAYRAMDNPGGKGHFLEVVEYAFLDDALFQLLHDSDARERLRQILISRYFAEHSDQISALRRQERPIGLYEDYLLKKAIGTAGADPVPDADDRARDTAFSRVVRAAYDYRCAACGLRVFLDDGTILVDAAHIIPYSVSRDDDPRNGMALCRNHHWAMDRLLIAPVPSGDRPLWRVSPALDTRIEGQADLLSLDGARVILPRESRFLPKPDSLNWRLLNLRKMA